MLEGAGKREVLKTLLALDHFDHLSELEQEQTHGPTRDVTAKQREQQWEEIRGLPMSEIQVHLPTRVVAHLVHDWMTGDNPPAEDSSSHEHLTHIPQTEDPASEQSVVEPIEATIEMGEDNPEGASKRKVMTPAPAEEGETVPAKKTKL